MNERLADMCYAGRYPVLAAIASVKSVPTEAYHSDIQKLLRSVGLWAFVVLK
jgi:hypothetical protein